MNKILVSQLDDAGYFVSFTYADESPREPGVFPLPGGCVYEIPPEIPGGKRAKFDGAKFALEDVIATDEQVDQQPDSEPPSFEQMVAKMSAAIQKRLDDFAATRLYDNAASMAKYVNLSDSEIASLPTEDQPAVKRYRSECRYLLLKVAQTWATAERILNEVRANNRPEPQSIDDIEDDLPALAWPAE